MNVLVTGATGIIGRQAIPRLREAGHEVAGMARSAAAAGWLRPTSRPALGLLGSLGVQLALRDGLVKGRQRLPRQPVMDAERLGPGIV